jgi:uncharacterized UBP type Zn finger protein
MQNDLNLDSWTCIIGSYLDCGREREREVSMMGKSNPLRLDHYDGQQLYQKLSVLLRGEIVGLSIRSIPVPIDCYI